MPNVVTLPKRDDVLDQASLWLSRVDRGLSPDEEGQLKEWLGQSVVHRNTFLEMAQLWDKMDSLSRLSKLFPRTETRAGSRLLAPFALAASLVIALFVGMLVTVNRDSAREELAESTQFGEQFFVTGTGEQSTIVLADGSTIILNTNTAVRSRFTDGQRALFLDQGEVNVQVAHDAKRPFNVYVDDRVVQAVGTAFNLEITEGRQIELIVTEGRVIVEVLEEKNSSDPVTPLMKVETADVTLKAGEQVKIADTAQKIEPIQPEEIEVKLSWKGGNLVFRGESLEQAITEIERYTPVQFMIVDDDLKQVRVAGLFKAGDVEGLLSALEQNFNVRSRRLNDGRILLSGAPLNSVE